MVFEIADGRKEFYQWDINRYLKINEENITEVHFDNRTEITTLVVKVKDGMCAVPNILLQNNSNIRVYAFVDNEYTKIEQVFKVIPRSRPSDYVYTETQVQKIEDVINKALQEAKDSGEFKGEPGPQGDPGEKGDKGDKPVKGEDYFTAADKEAIVNDIVNALPKAENNSGKYGLVKLGNKSKGLNLTDAGELQMLAATKLAIDMNSTELVVIRPAYMADAIARNTHEQMSDDYDVSDINLNQYSDIKGLEGLLPVSYDAVKGYINNKINIDKIVEAVLSAIPNGDEVSY